MNNKGRTLVVSASIDGATIRIQRIGKTSKAQANDRALRASETVSHGVLTYQGRIRWYVNGRERAPDADPLSIAVENARQLGLLRLDPLLAGADEVIDTFQSRTGADPPSIFVKNARQLEMFGVDPLPTRADEVTGTLPIRTGADPRTRPLTFRALAEGQDTRVTVSPAAHECFAALDDIHALAPVPQEVTGFARLPGVLRAWLFPSRAENVETRKHNLYEVVLLMDGHRLLSRQLTDTSEFDLLDAAVTTHQQDKVIQQDNDAASWLQCGFECKNEGMNRAAVMQSSRLQPWRLRRVGALLEAEWCTERLNDIFQCLHPEARGEFLRIGAYNLLLGEGVEEVCIARIQASRALQGGAAMLADPSRTGREILASVDARRKLAPSVAQHLRVPAWVVRRLALTPPEILDRLDRDPKLSCPVKKLVEWIGSENPLTSIDDLSVFYALQHLLGTGIWGKARVQLLARVFRRSVAQAGGITPFGLQLHALKQREEMEFGLWDYFRFVENVLLTAVAPHCPGGRADFQRPAFDRALAILFADASLMDIVRWSTRYHALVHGTRLAPKRARVNSTAPELLSDQTLPRTGWQVRQLRTLDDLQEEGRELKHCVATYYEDMRRRVAALFSLSPADGNGITVELRRTDRAWTVRQVRGENNALVPPGSPGAFALEEFLDLLEANSPQIGEKVLASYRTGASRRRRVSWFEQLLQSYGLRAWKMIRHLLPGSAHGRIEPKLWAAFSEANARLLRQAERRWTPR